MAHISDIPKTTPDQVTPDQDTSSLLKKSPLLGDYRLVSKIGQGGIAEIYKAIQLKLNREVAVKILSSKLCRDEEIVRRFDRESMTIASLNHPNIVHVIDRGFSHGRYYFVMEYVEGASFKEVLRKSDLPLRTSLEMIVMTLKGLDYAHKNGVIHRDVKPANILIDLHGNAKVADFGIAHLAGAPDGEATSANIVMGTMAYMSPEQKLSSTNVDHTTDIYAVGVMLYEALLGQKPLGKFKLPSEMNPKIPAGFDRIIERSLATDPNERYQSAVAFKDELLDLVSSHSQQSKSDPARGAVRGVEGIVGKCRFLDTIRENAHGATYLVEEAQSKKLIVIKRSNQGKSGLREAQRLAKLSHENIATILGAGGDGDKTVVVMEYAPGGSLADRLVRKYSWKETFELGAKLAGALSAAAQQAIVHGNLRPSNVLFDESDTPKLTDFGMPAHYTTRRNWYAPPEKGSSSRGDVYALGVILHQMIFGKTPSYTRNGEIFLDAPPSRVPARVIDILKRLLALQCAERYQSPDEFLDAWREFDLSMGGSESAKSRSAVMEKPKKGHLTGAGMFVIGLGLGMIIGIAIAYFADLFG
ncbi:MAG: protein kinase [Candidatus Zixiibacteriota bacterium]